MEMLQELWIGSYATHTAGMTWNSCLLSWNNMDRGEQGFLTEYSQTPVYLQDSVSQAVAALHLFF